MASFVGTALSETAMPSTSEGMGSRMSSPSRLPKTGRIKELLHKEWDSVPEMQSIHHQIQKEALVAEAREKVEDFDKENGPGSYSAPSTHKLAEALNRVDLGTKIEERSAYYRAKQEAKKKEKQQAETELKIQLTRERDFQRAEKERKEREKLRAKKNRDREWEERRRVKSLREAEEKEAERATLRDAEDQRKAKAALDEKLRQDKIMERRRNLIEKRAAKKRLEEAKIQQKKAENAARNEDWDKEKAHRKNMHNAKKVKNLVYNNLGKLNEETNYLDMPAFS